MMDNRRQIRNKSIDQILMDASIEILNDFDSLVEQKINIDSNVLDIGTGNGKFIYRLYHKFGLKKLRGVEKELKVCLARDPKTGFKTGVEEVRSNYLQCISNYDLISFIEDSFRNNDKLEIYEFYKKYVSHELGLKDDYLTKSEFLKVFPLEFGELFNKDKFKDEKFDFIILSRVIHQLGDEANVIKIIKDCIDLLNNNGVLYISFPVIGKKLDEAIFNKIMDHFPQLIEVEGSRRKVDEDPRIIIVYKGVKHST